MTSELTGRTPEAVARSYFDALEAGDINAMISMVSPDIIEDITGVGILRGQGELREFFTAFRAAFPDGQWTVERIVADDRTAVVQWRSTGTFNGEPFQGIEPTGRFVTQRGCDVLEVVDGVIVRNTAYQDGMTFARAVGLLPPQDSGAEKALFAAFNAATKLRSRLSL